MISKDSISLQFMLKEYEKLYNKLDSHQQAVEKTIQLYFVFIGGLISINSLVEKQEEFSIFYLNGLRLFLFLIISIIGLITFFKVIEHRLLIISYVKSINLNRKWFVDNTDDKMLSNYLYWIADVKNPPFYKKFRHFYWESLGIAIINAIFISVFIINCFRRLFNYKTIYADNINWVLLIFITSIITAFLMAYYKRKGQLEEDKIKKRFNTI